MVLKMTIDKVIKELGLKATAENMDLSTAKATPADVYFTSHELLNDLQASVKALSIPSKNIWMSLKSKCKWKSF